ncbi:hypothetical protein [Cupriavidus sp. D39]|uniref:hypothetical protein n=1 Tax=Cupriavidus sp. D39 TaxID=2997877 RepID=UPI003B63632E
MLLIHGAMAVLFRAKDKGARCEQLARRRPTNVTVVALANNAARIAWTALMGNEPYIRNHELRKAERARQMAGSALGRLRLANKIIEFDQKVARVNVTVMARQVGPQERHPVDY